MSILVNLKKTIKTSTPLFVLIAATSSFSMDQKPIETQTETVSTTTSQFEENHYPINDFNLADIEFGFSDEITPTVSFGGLLHIATTYVDRSTVRALADAIPGCGFLIKNAYDVYSQPEGQANPESLSTKIGERLKEKIETVPGGNTIIGAASFLKAPGEPTFGSTLAKIFVPAAKVDVSGTTDEIAGKIAQATTEALVPGKLGPYVNAGFSYVAKNTMGTPTVTGGLAKIAMNAIKTKEEDAPKPQEQAQIIDEPSDDEDEFFSHSSDSNSSED